MVFERHFRRTVICLALISGTIGASITPALATADVLILGPTATSGIENNVVTTGTSTPVPGYPSVNGLGLTAHVASTSADWLTQLADPNYKAIVLGDPTCSGAGPTAWAETPAAQAALATRVKGDVVLIGTDLSLHTGAGGVSGVQLWASSIRFAVAGYTAGHGTGAVISLSCYYTSAAASTSVPVLDALGATPGAFKVQGNLPCAGNVSIVASSPALTGLTGGPGGTLSAWGCSVHEGFNAWDPSFTPLAIATDPTVPQTITGTDADTGGSVSGFPYILARGVTPAGGKAVVKVCKVAGPGIATGTPFTFGAGSASFSVPAGPPPGGYCVVGTTAAVGATATVSETIPSGTAVSSITVAPPSALSGTPNLAAGTVNVTAASGVTEVTYTDYRNTGYLEICKTGDVKGDYTFYVNPGKLGPFTVPAGACSPAIEVTAGTVVISEMPGAGPFMSGCSTIPPAMQGPCDPKAGTSTVTVMPGDISAQTIAMVRNGPRGIPVPVPSRGTGSIPSTTALECVPAKARAGETVACTARVSARSAKPTGEVDFLEGRTKLGHGHPDADGVAVFTTVALPPGPHAIVAVYDGNSDVAPSTSAQVDVTVAAH
jgi:hypothetical protein